MFSALAGGEKWLRFAKTQCRPVRLANSLRKETQLASFFQSSRIHAGEAGVLACHAAIPGGISPFPPRRNSSGQDLMASEPRQFLRPNRPAAPRLASFLRFASQGPNRHAPEPGFVSQFRPKEFKWLRFFKSSPRPQGVPPAKSPRRPLAGFVPSNPKSPGTSAGFVPSFSLPHAKFRLVFPFRAAPLLFWAATPLARPSTLTFGPVP